MNLPVLIISFSGGRTSAYMTKMLIDIFGAFYRIIVVFANTGQEHEETLLFVKRCDEVFNFKTVWVEAVVDPIKGRGTRHKIVTFETADRKGGPYEAVIAKYGLANRNYIHCTRELKEMPVKSYIASLGITEFDMAIGLRIDEIKKRRAKKAKIMHMVYPLADWFPATKAEILEWWSRQTFDLQIAEHHGNCTWCYKKSLKKLLMVLNETPEVFDFPLFMEMKYSLVGQTGESAGTPRKIFRENRSVIDLFQLKADDDAVILDDAASECGESCEPFGGIA